MRRLITALASLAVVSLLIPSIGLAIEPPVENGVGILCIFTSEDLAAADNVIPIVTPFRRTTCTSCIYNEQTHLQQPGWHGVQLALGAGYPRPCPLLSSSFPPETLNIGDQLQCDPGLRFGLCRRRTTTRWSCDVE